MKLTTRRQILIAGAAATLPVRVNAGPVAPGAAAWATRMAAFGVTGMSVAVIDRGRIATGYDFGVACRDERRPVRHDTRFQAASISKPVSAYGAMILVDRGLLSLDAPILNHVRQWAPQTNLDVWRRITLRQILTHSAGLTVHGFGGYEVGRALPTSAQVIDGVPPANSPPVEPTLPVGRYSYSGGGFVLMQMAMEDVTGQPFDGLMRDLVLRPLAMRDSSFVPPLSATASFACGHDTKGMMIQGRFHLYPERAAAGLWTTPDDLARFAIALSTSAIGARMLEPAPLPTQGAGPRTGLSLAIGATGVPRVFSHGGANAGFRCIMIGLPDTGQGVVVMTNGDDGGPLYREMVRAVAAAQAWPEGAISQIWAREG